MNRTMKRKPGLLETVGAIVVTVMTVVLLLVLLWLAQRPYAFGQYTNVGPGARLEGPTVTNYVSQYWGTNGNGGGLYNFSAGLSTSNMLVWTNINGGTFQTNYYLIFNDITWRTNTSVPLWYKPDVWDCGTNYPDVGPSIPVNYYGTTNNNNAGQWWQNTSSKPWPASTFTVTATAWNTFTGWHATNGPAPATNINYGY